MRRALIIAATIAICTQSLIAGTWIRSYAQAQAEAKKKNQLIFVDLFADWCGWCHRMEQEVFPSETFQNATQNLVKLRLNTEDGGEGTRLAKQFNVGSLPTFLLLTADNKVAGMIMGYAPPSDFVKKLGDTQKQYETFRAKTQQERANAKNYQWRLDLAREFVDRRSFPDAEKRLNALIADTGAPVALRDQASIGLAVAFANEAKIDAAVKTLTGVVENSKTKDAVDSSRFILGQIYAQQGNYKASLVQLRALKSSSPQSQYIGAVDQMLPQVEKLAGKQ